MSNFSPKLLRVGLGGLGAVGKPVAEWLNKGVSGLTLTAVSARNKPQAQKFVKSFKKEVKVVNLKQLPDLADVIVECAPPSYFIELAEATLLKGLIFIPLSITSLLERQDLIDVAHDNGGRIIVPSGAIVGLDAVRAASYGTINSVIMKTNKPPNSLKDSKFVVENQINLNELIGPKCLFRGSVREAASLFPANVNITVALAFSGIGPDLTQYELWADPSVDRNCHTVVVDSDSTHFKISIAGIPTDLTPATGKLTPLSVMSTLEGLVSSFKIGN